MFFSFFNVSYNPETNLFDYAFAGNEPGFYYDAKADSFEDWEAKGLVLGFDRHVKYLQYEQQLSKGDMIVLLTDGVTECRTEEGFIERLDIIKLIRKYMHLSPPEIVKSV